VIVDIEIEVTGTAFASVTVPDGFDWERDEIPEADIKKALAAPDELDLEMVGWSYVDD